jgi:outer membrane protein assembly factor BamB
MNRLLPSLFLIIYCHCTHARIEHEPQLAWSIDTGAAIYSSASIVDGLAFFGNSAGMLYAVHVETGAIEWKTDTGSAIYSQPLIHNERLYLYNDAGTLLCFAIASGNQLWSKPIAEKEARKSHFGPEGWDYRSSSPVTDGSHIFMGTWQGKVLSIDPGEGKIIWQHQGKAKIRSSAALSGKQLVIADYAGKIVSLDKNSGKLIWIHDTEDAISESEEHLTIINNDPLIIGDTVFIGSRNTRLYALDLHSGETRWIFPLHDSWVESDLQYHHGVLYAGSSFRKAQLAFKAETGEPLWQSHAANGLFYSNAAVTDDALYTGTVAVDELQYPGFLSDAFLVKINAENGEPAWRFPIQKSKDRKEHGVVAPVLLSEDYLLFGSFNGKFYALKDVQKEYPIDVFAVDRHQLKPGEKTTIQWRTSGADQIYLNGEQVEGHGKKTVQPSASTQYTLSVKGKQDEEQSIQIELLPASEINLSQFAGIEASSTENSMSKNARYLIADNQSNTRWASEWKDDQWISLDLGQQYSLDRIILNWEAAYAEHYSLQASMDGSEWRDFYHQESSQGGIEEIKGISLKTRYIKLKAHKRATPYGISLYEFSVFEK